MIQNRIRIEVIDPKGILYDAMMSIVSGKMRKDELAAIFRKLAKTP